LCVGLVGSTIFLLAGGSLFWAAVIFLTAIMPEEDSPRPASGAAVHG
jgi:hypothetical protein